MRKLLLVVSMLALMATSAMAQTPRFYYATLAASTGIVLDMGVTKGGFQNTVRIPKLITAWDNTSTGNGYIIPCDINGNLVSFDDTWWGQTTTGAVATSVRFWLSVSPLSFDAKSRYVKLYNANGATSRTIYMMVEY